ncbi:SDR family NAD(P)-dependent oxidoreductase [Hyphococcus luteus]|uniref:NAD(P)-dependent oxidoreductase n=1 Tax=Hyphococcus luteus TaxID=2058213 RepID=A0A2S7K3D7_9PROT|nr:SDR family NAD(P)-dependent oxidoreductase [Marinicaulis flavus]PQA87024.1 NAD(P)-dependent oxidoreductase [Marinicaulis flavus]
MLKDVSGKTAFITGGASGMGLGMAKVFARHGMNVVIADVRQSALDEAMSEFKDTNFPVHPIKLDVTDRDAWVEAADEAEKVYGNIHLLVLNAGVGVAGKPMQNCTYKDWDFSINVNIGGVVNGVVTVLPRMLKHGEPAHVLTTSSTGGFSAVGGAGLYCTTKFAVTGMMESLATDLQGTNVGASVFYPGPVKTSLGQTTHEVRPAHLRDETPPAAGEAPPRDIPPFDPNVFMDPEEVGERVLRGITRGDLFIMSHPEFKDGLVARNDALVRSIPQDPPNDERAKVVKLFGTLIYNPIYDEQKDVPALD